MLSFLFPHRFKVHKWTHTGEKYFACSKCDITFGKITKAFKNALFLFLTIWKCISELTQVKSCLPALNVAKLLEKIKAFENALFFVSLQIESAWVNSHRWKALCLLQMWQKCWQNQTIRNCSLFCLLTDWKCIRRLTQVKSTLPAQNVSKFLEKLNH